MTLLALTIESRMNTTTKPYGESEQRQFEAAPRPERVVRRSEQAGALPLYLEKDDCHQQD